MNNDIKKNLEFKKIVVYKCNYCQTKYNREVFSCSNCGSSDISKIFGDKKYCYIDSNGMRLTENKRTNRKIKIEDSVNTQLFHSKLAIFSTVIWVLALPLIILLAIFFMFSIETVGDFAYKIVKDSPLSRQFQNMFVNGSTIIVLILEFALLTLFLLKFLDKVIKPASEIHNKSVEDFLNQKSKWQVPKKYLLVVGLNYEIFPILGLKNRYGVRVKHYTSNNICLTLNSKKTFSSFPHNTIDLLINPENFEDNCLDFDLEEYCSSF